MAFWPGSEDDGREEKASEIQTKDGLEENVTESEAQQDRVLQMLEEMSAQEQKEFGRGFLAGILVAVVCIVVFMGGWNAARNGFLRRSSGTAESETEAGAEILTDSSTLQKLNEVQSLIEQKYLNEVDGELLQDFIFKGIAVGLQDPYAAYYTAEELQSVTDSNRGEYFGIGAVLSVDEETGEIRTIQVYDDSPAQEAGLQEGDVLLAVDGEELTGMDLSAVTALIKSKEDGFSLLIFRSESGISEADQEDGRELELQIQCDNVELNYVEYEWLGSGIGYIRITEFTRTAVEQFQTAADALNDQGMEKLIVDLRDNPGGLLTSVCDILDEILPKGLIVYTEDRDGKRQEYNADGKRRIDCPVAVLVNGNSASASEIFAGAIQDYDLGPIIGTQTYGKGVVQNTFTLSDGSAFKMTVDKYFTAAGQDIQDNGITPDIVVEEASGDETGSLEDREAVDEEETDGLENSGNTEEREPAAADDPVLGRAVEELKK